MNEVRIAGIDDVTAIAGIHVRSWAATYPAIPAPTLAEAVDVWTRRLSPESGYRTLVAMTSSRVVGFVSFHPTTAYVQSLYVDPDVTRGGVGTRLIDVALGDLQRAGHTEASLSVVDTNQLARRFYERNGWRTDGSRQRETLVLDSDAGPLVDVVRYTRALEPRRPKYYELRLRLRDHVDGLAPGTQLAPERTLSEEFNLSRTTVRQALHDLAVEGRLVRQQGRGTFVAPPKVTQNLQLTSYTQDMVAQGRRPSSKLVDVAVIAADDDIADQLRLAQHADVWRVERVRYADAEPMAVETVYLGHARFPGLGDRLDAGSSLYSLLDTGYGVVPAEADETIETVLAPPAISRLLGTDSRTPMLLLTRRTTDEHGTPVEYVRSLYRGDRYRFAAKISRP